MDASLHKRAEQLATEFASQARTAEDLKGLMRLIWVAGRPRRPQLRSERLMSCRRAGNPPGLPRPTHGRARGIVATANRRRPCKETSGD